ncbi:uncharacterized protein LOC123308643 [Coccinella septempunctata]|uniref:uncharacterized protein LOC123308643 n=1 Tax=Coccinella septempunctata TaxID=41139 RepID=UPI001D0683EE|nr:uncharacterized protein LOC123308643 [Coccinella septempunctata]
MHPKLGEKTPAPKYDYFSKPDGEDVPKKLWYTLQPAAASAFALSTIDVMLMTKPKGYVNILMRFGYVSFPIIGCTTAFVLTSNFLGSLRQKSDRLNWAVGGMAAGGVVGLWRRKQITGCLCALAFGFLGYMRKYGADNGFVIFPETRSHFSLRSAGYDYTLAKDVPGNYTKGPAKAEM